MKKKFTLIFLLFICLLSNAQIKNNEIGFHCYVDGGPTETVKKFTILLLKSKYHKVVKLLDSKKSSEKFLAALVCKEINNDKIILTEKQISEIDKIFKSQELIELCDGCLYYEKTTMSNLFIQSKNADYYFSNQFNDWIKYCLKGK